MFFLGIQNRGKKRYSKMMVLVFPGKNETRLCNSVGIELPVLEKAMAPHSSTLAWKIPWMEEPGGLQSMGSLRVRHD